MSDVTAGDIKLEINAATEKLLDAQRNDTRIILDRIDKSENYLVATIFSESEKTRALIGNQTILLKTLQDNIKDIVFNENDDSAISSNIELSIGAEIFGCGARWVLNIDTSKIDFQELLQQITLMSNVPEKVKATAISKLKKQFKAN